MQPFFSWSLLSCLALLLSCKPTEVPQEPEKDLGPKPFGEMIDEQTFRINPYGNFDVGEFRLWVPEEAEEVRAILVLSSSHNSNGLGLALVEQWQSFAATERLAILALHFKSFPGGSGSYSAASDGSGQALLRALDTLAIYQGKPELGQLPLLLRGYSAGGVFSFNFADYQPERVLAWVNIRGGSINLAESENPDIPGLMLMGELDDPTRNSRIRNVVELNRATRSANWSYAVEPDTDHFGGLTRSDELIQSLFSKVLARRLVDGFTELSEIPETSGWLGNNETREIAPFSTYSGPKSEASWLVDEEFARLWKAYQED